MATDGAIETVVGGQQTAPDLLDLLDALVVQDRGAPGFEGRLAIGLINRDERSIRWWLVRFEPHRALTSFSSERHAGAHCECMWLLADRDSPGSGRLPSERLETLVRVGPEAILTRLSSRYLNPARGILALRARALSDQTTSTEERPRAKKRRRRGD